MFAVLLPCLAASLIGVNSFARDVGTSSCRNRSVASPAAVLHRDLQSVEKAAPRLGRSPGQSRRSSVTSRLRRRSSGASTAEFLHGIFVAKHGDDDAKDSGLHQDALAVFTFQGFVMLLTAVSLSRPIV